MATAGNPVMQAIQVAVQPKLIDNGWVVEENDTTLCEYISMMLLEGKDANSVRSEMGGELLGLGDDDPSVGEFVRWLFAEVHDKIVAPKPTTQPIQTVQEDASVQVGGAPTGPKSMRSTGRGGRMLGQLNRQMDRSQELPDGLRRIRGAAGGASGRINSHANRDGPPRGPRGGGAASGLQRMMGGGRGGHAMTNPMMQIVGGSMDQQQQMQMMQFMEMQTNMMMQMMQNGQVPNANNGFNQRGAQRGGRQKAQSGRQQPQQQHAVNGRLPDGPLQAGSNADTSMDVDSRGANPVRSFFDTLCHFNYNCNNASCAYAHQSPAAPEGMVVDLTDTCPHAAACQNTKCSARHPSPALRNNPNTPSEIDCKFGTNCTRQDCPFRHNQKSMPACHYGTACTAPNCPYDHTVTTKCKFNPCTRDNCPFVHTPDQKSAKHGSKVWTKSGGGNGNGQNGNTSNRFADVSQQTADGEELIVPGQQNNDSTENVTEAMDEVN